MTGIVDWAASRARMVLAFIALSLLAGALAYQGLPKEGEPDIEIPAVAISLPFPGISAIDAEELLIKPMETELGTLDGLDTMTSTAAEGYANVVLEFEFGWDKTATLADVRDAMSKAEADFPDGFEQYTIEEFNFSEFPIVVVSLTGDVPERTLLRVAKGLQDRLEGIDAVLEAELAGHRDEMIEVVIDPLRLESYNVTAGELLTTVQNNNALVAAGAIDGPTGSNAIKIDSAFDDVRDIYDLPVKTNGDRVVTLGDLADIRLTFEDREGTARFNGETTVAVQVVKRKGFNLIDTVALVREEVAAEVELWPEELREAVQVRFSGDTSREVNSMVQQLQGSVLTAIALVMIVVLASLGTRSALLVGFAIPTSFLLCFAFLAVMGVSISNIVMFGLILAVGMLVDGAIVVVEYADKRLAEGDPPFEAYTSAAKRMFWPIVSSTATTLCAFLPMLFWPGVPGEFMGMLPVTLIFVLSASLIVALVYLPVMGLSIGALANAMARLSAAIRRMPLWMNAAAVPVAAASAGLGALGLIAAFGQVQARFGAMDGGDVFGTVVPNAALAFLAIVAVLGTAVLAVGGGVFALFAIAALVRRLLSPVARLGRAVSPFGRRERLDAGRRRTLFGRFIALIAGNPYAPLACIGAVFVSVVSVFLYFGSNNYGVEFFVETEPEQSIVYVRARGNLSLEEKDALLSDVERIMVEEEGIRSAFAFAGSGGLNANTGGGSSPLDTIGQVQIEMVPWDERAAFAASGETDLTVDELDGNAVIDRLQARLDALPGIYTEVSELAQGPAQGKALHLRLLGGDLGALEAAAETVRARFEATPGLIDVEDTLPLPGIDWEIDVDVEAAGRFGADVQTVGAMVQLITRGLLLDTMRVDSSDEEIDIRVRLPEEDRLLSTLDTLKARTSDGLVPLANFVTREPVAKLGLINRVGEERHYDVKADVSAASVLLTDPSGTAFVAPAASIEPGGTYAEAVAGGELTADVLNANERIGLLTEWLETEAELPPGVEWEWTGDQEEQTESQAFLMVAFAGALGLMFIVLLAQFNSFYNAVLVLIAVVMSTAGALIGMLVMQQPFSIIMTGTGIVALAGIVVNNNIVLIDTYQEYSRYMPRIEAIVRTAEDRIRPVLLTTITTMAGLAPMMFGLSLDFIGGGYSIDSPTSLWWKQLATAVVFGLGVATVLTLVFTPAMLAARVWAGTILAALFRTLGRFGLGRTSRAGRDWVLRREARRAGRGVEIVWDDAPPAPAETGTTVVMGPPKPLAAAE